MSYLFKGLPWLVVGAALYHLTRTFLDTKEQHLLARQQTERKIAHQQRLYRLAVATNFPLN